MSSMGHSRGTSHFVVADKEGWCRRVVTIHAGVGDEETMGYCWGGCENRRMTIWTPVTMAEVEVNKKKTEVFDKDKGRLEDEKSCERPKSLVVRLEGLSAKEGSGEVCGRSHAAAIGRWAGGTARQVQWGGRRRRVQKSLAVAADALG